LKAILSLGFLAVAALFMEVPNAHAIQVSYTLNEEGGSGTVTGSHLTELNERVEANLGDYEFFGSVLPDRVGLIGVSSGFRAAVSRFIPGFSSEGPGGPLGGGDTAPDSDTGGGGPGDFPSTEWTRVTIDTSAAGIFETDAVVNGLNGTNNVGFVKFDWVVTGLSDIYVDAGNGPPSGSVIVHDAVTAASIGVISEDSSIPDAFVHRATPGLNGFISDTSSASLGVDSFLVPYDFSQLNDGENPLVDVDFEFAVTTHLNITNQDDLGNFEALFNADFTNTATLTNVTVLDINQQLIPGASVVDSFTGQSLVASSVPEPSVAIVLLIAGCAGSVRRRRCVA
jgi:hypothetical protein